MSAPPVVYSTSTAPAIIEAYAARYAIDAEIFLAVAKCESGLRESAWNKQDPRGGSKGVFQFQPHTFATYSKLAGIEEADVWNPLHNIEVAAFMFAEGLEEHWTCWRKLTS